MKGRKLLMSILTGICACLMSVTLFTSCGGEKHTHSYTSQTTNATCTEKGLIMYTCSCGDSYTETVPVLGHDEKTHEAKAPTCTEIGWEEYVTCERNGCDYSTYVEIPALDHEYGQVMYTWKEEYCNAERICSHDNEHKETETVAAVYKKDTDATCDTPEMGHYQATFENNAFETQNTAVGSVIIGEELGHSYGEWISNNNGTHTQTCANDKNHKITKDCNGGTATCTEKAQCKDCGAEYGKLLSHEYEDIKSNQILHWIECSCGEKTAIEFHRGGTATCTKLAECSVCFSEYGELEKHSYTKLEKSATEHWNECVCGDKQGVENHKGGTATCVDKPICTTCKIEYGQAKGHSYHSVVTEPTCEEQGCTTYTCHCGDSYADNYVDELGHKEVIDEAVAPTCTETGLTQGKHCLVCKEILEEQQIVDALGHTYGDWIIEYYPTNVEEGLKYKICSSCNNEEEEIIPIPDAITVTLNDSEISYEYTVTFNLNYTGAPNPNVQIVTSTRGLSYPQPTRQYYAFAGWYTNYSCTGSPYDFTAEVTKDMVLYAKWVSSFDDEDFGKSFYIYERQSRYIAFIPLASSYVYITQSIEDCCITLTLLEGSRTGTVIKTSTDGYISCEVKAGKLYYLKVYNTNYYNWFYGPVYCTIPVPASGGKCGTYLETAELNYYENFNLTVPKKDGCIFGGWYDGVDGTGTRYTDANGVSTRVWDKIENTTLYAHWHDEKTHEAKASTCTEIGWEEYVTCEREGCDYTTYKEIPAGHDYIHHEAQEATCTEIGWDAYNTCSCCNYTEYKEIPALGHDEKTHEAKAPTCTEIGWEEYVTCEREGCDYTTYKEIPAGHDYIHHEAQEATCTEIGWDAYNTCSRCNYTEYKEIPALGHDEKTHEAKAPTCTEIGWEEYVTCEREGCDYTTYKEIPALGHDEKTHEAKAPTCTEIGWDAYNTCSRCNYTEYKEIPAGHDYIHHEAQEATCTEIGWDAYNTCSRCNYTEYKEISMKHNAQDNNGLCLGCGLPESSTGLNYSQNSDGTYTVTGIGSFMGTRLVIGFYNGKDVTSIGELAFYGCNSLISVVIGDNVTSIGELAFYGCNSLISVVIGDNVTSIGELAFYGCEGLINVEIPDIVTSIGASAFGECINLISVEIPDSVISIGDCAFAACTNLTSINVDVNNSMYQSIDGNLYTEDGKTLIQYAIGKTATSFTIPRNVTSIGVSAFYGCSSLTSITFADTIESIGSYAFSDCSGLKSIVIPDSVTSIVGYAFYACDSLTSVYYKGTATEWAEITIGSYNSNLINAVRYYYSEQHPTSGGKYWCYVDDALVLWHDFITVIDHAIAPTCTETGLTEGEHCSVCNEVLVPQEVVPANGHNYADVVTAPTCTEQGYTTYTCTVCGNSYVSNYLVENGHSAGAIVVENEILPTCTQIGGYENVVYCITCAEELKRETVVVNATGHSVVIDNAILPTCTETGLTEGKHCLVCNEVLVPQGVVSANGHDYVGVVTAPTCTEQGYTTYTCTVCGNSYVSNYVVENGHTEVVDSTVLPTCTETGLTEGKHCSVCSEVLVPQEVVSANGHNYAGVITAPTCLKRGYTTYTCTTCSDVYIANYTTALGHDYIFHEARAVTCLAVGWDAYNSCSRCNYTEYKEISIKHNAQGNNGLCLGCGLPESSAGLEYSKNSDGTYIVEDIASFTGARLVIGFYNGKDVTSIGSYAFSGCSGLTVVLIGDCVESIGYSAFEGCSKLTSIEIPDSVTSIGAYAFKGCSSLTSVVIPGSVTSIGYSAFEGCSKLTSIEIPDSVTSIGSYAFNNCSLLKRVNYTGTIDDWAQIQFNRYQANPVYYAKKLYINNVLVTDAVFTSATKINAYAFSSCSSLTGVTMGNSVTSIGDSAFSGCSGLTSIEIPDSVTSIGSAAFSGCSSLTSLVIPDSVTSIGDSAFYNCPIEIASIPAVACNSISSSLKEVVITSGSSIGGYAFYGCSGLTSIEIPDSVTSIDLNAFYDCTSLAKVNYTGTTNDWAQIQFACDYANPLYYAKKLYINNALVTEANITDATEINNYAFYNCTKLTSVTIGSGVTSIGSNAFYNCSLLKRVNYTGTIDDWAQIEFANRSANPLYYAEKLYINNVLVTEANITTAIKINDYLFSGCSSLTSLVIPDSVTSIGDSTFSGCSGLTSIEIPDSVTSIGSAAFRGCSSLTSVVIPDSVTSIGYSAFEGCSKLTSIEIPDSVTSIGSVAFSGCSSLTSIKIPDSQTSIGDSTFYGCSGLTSIEIPDSVTSIGRYAFEDCSKLTSIEIPNSVTSIDERAFAYCESLTRVVIGDGVTNIPERAFICCHRLTSVVIGENVTTIGTDAFDYCERIIEVVNKSPHITLTRGSTSNGGVAYYALNIYNSGDAFTTKLSNDNGYIIYTTGQAKILVGYVGTETDLVLPSYITYIYQRAFYSSDSLTSVVIPDSVAGIGSYAFAYCYGLASITIPDSVTSIEDHAFYYAGLTKVVLGSGVKSIGQWAFSCGRLVEVVNKSAYITISKGDTAYGNIGYHAFAVYNSEEPYTTKLSNDNGYIIYTDGNRKILIGYTGKETDLVLPSYITEINRYAFYWSRSLTSVLIGDSVTSIGDYAFSGCISFTSIAIPDSVTSIDRYTFLDCHNLTQIEFEDTSTWYRTTSSSNLENKTGGTSTSVTNSSTNATNFKSTYYNYYWYKL